MTEATQPVEKAPDPSEPFSRIMDEVELRAAVGSFHSGEVAVVRFATRAGVSELKLLGELHAIHAIKLCEVPQQALLSADGGWSSPQARQRAFKIRMKLTWQMFWDSFPDPTIFENITVIH